MRSYDSDISQVAFRLEILSKDNELRSYANKTRHLFRKIELKMKFFTTGYVLKTVRSDASTSQFR